jgi:hypothetical protein
MSGRRIPNHQTLSMVQLSMHQLNTNLAFVLVTAKNRAIKAAAVALAAFILLLAANSQGKEEEQQVWIVSTRGAPLSGDLQSGQKAIRYWRLSTDRQWQDLDEESFLSGADPAAPNTFIIHGNRDNPDDAIAFAWPIYCRMLKNAQNKPFRLVIWSWPSEQACRRNRPDVQLKFSYCDAQAYYLGACLEHLRTDVPVSLIGYSMGAKIAAGSLHLLGGGDVACRKLPGRDSSNQAQKRATPVRVLMVAAAIDADSLAADGIYNLALSQTESILITRNGCDRVLKLYPRIYGRRGPDALGFVGLAGCSDTQKIDILDLSCEVGKVHKWKNYLTSGSLLNAIDRYVFGE